MLASIRVLMSANCQSSSGRISTSYGTTYVEEHEYDKVVRPKWGVFWRVDRSQFECTAGRTACTPGQCCSGHIGSRHMEAGSSVLSASLLE